MSGKLFVIDGTDGSGKQTQFSKLTERLDKEKIPYKKLSFPRYDNPSSSLVKMYLAGEFGQNAKDVSAYIASIFYAVDRYAAYKQEFEQFYKQGGLVLADRYTTANMVHQAGKIKDKEEREKFLKWLFDLEYNIFGIPKPTETFFLNMPPEYALKLMENRENKITHESKKDIHERDRNHIVDSYNAACDLVDEYNWYEIKCVKDGKIRTIDDIHEEIFNEIKKHIKKIDV
ncbi:MAG: thymidylate kinase [Clostridia bacterium]|nr:thymidylate kinase [Clostridia bacterium]